MTDNTKVSDVESVPQEAISEKPAEQGDNSQNGFRFFKNCSASLKRFSVLLFAINVFLIVVSLIVGVALVVIYLGTDLLSLLAFPIISVVIILIILARFLSALVYGFAEIVEKNEK